MLVKISLYRYRNRIVHLVYRSRIEVIDTTRTYTRMHIYMHRSKSSCFPDISSKKFIALSHCMMTVVSDYDDRLFCEKGLMQIKPQTKGTRTLIYLNLFFTHSMFPSGWVRAS